jgi:hypothetical protein
VASQELIQKVNELSQVILSIDKSKIIRTELGVESLEELITPIIDELYQKMAAIVKVAPYINDTILQSTIGELTNIFGQLNNLAHFPNQDFVSQKASHVVAIKAYIENIKSLWPHYYTALMEYFPKKESNSEALLEVASLTESIREKNNLAEEELKAFRKILDETQAIKIAAQNTAQQISIKEAQKQFKDAERPTYIKIGLAALGALFFFWWFFAQAYDFSLRASELQDIWTWKIAYSAGIRAVILGALFALLNFFLTLLKAYLHILEVNQHKLRVANSAEGLVAAAKTPEHQDLILSRLVDAIVDFGESGLLKDNPQDKSPNSRLSLDISSKPQS